MWSPHPHGCCLCCLHWGQWGDNMDIVPVIPITPTSSLLSTHHPHSPQKVPMWSPHPPWLWSPLTPPGTMWGQRRQHGRCPCHPHVIPVIPTSSPCCLEGPHIISNPPDTHLTHPHPLGRGGPKSVKMHKIWTNRDILILFEDLKFVETPPPMGGAWVGGWVSGWVG